MSESLQFSEESPSARVRIERTASGKMVKMLTVDTDASATEINSVVDKTVAGFKYLENKAAREVDDSDIPATPPLDPARYDTFEPL